MVYLDSKAILLFTLLVLSGAFTAVPASADPPINSSKSGIAIKGYDAVAYFTESRAVKGRREYAFQWRESTWYFSSNANRELFASDPERYAPKYGGF